MHVCVYKPCWYTGQHSAALRHMCKMCNFVSGATFCIFVLSVQKSGDLVTLFLIAIGSAHRILVAKEAAGDRM